MGYGRRLRYRGRKLAKDPEIDTKRFGPKSKPTLWMAAIDLIDMGMFIHIGLKGLYLDANRSIRASKSKGQVLDMNITTWIEFDKAGELRGYSLKEALMHFGAKVGI